MKDQILNDILKYAINRLNQAYGFCGVASGDDITMINSTNKAGEEIKIKFTIEK